MGGAVALYFRLLLFLVGDMRLEEGGREGVFWSAKITVGLIIKGA